LWSGRSLRWLRLPGLDVHGMKEKQGEQNQTEINGLRHGHDLCSFNDRIHVLSSGAIALPTPEPLCRLVLEDPATVFV
jgi:hypothetical protein